MMIDILDITYFPSIAISLDENKHLPIFPIMLF